MDKKILNKAAMYFVVQNLLHGNSDKTSVIRVFAKAITKLGELLGILSSKSEEVASLSKGKYEAKEAKEVKLKELVYSVVSALLAYSADTENAELKAKIKTTKSKLARMRERDLIIFSRNILKTVNEHRESLADYDISETDITTFGQLVNDYEQAKGEVGKGISSRVGVRKTQADIMNEVDTLLKDKIDKYMERLQTKFPEFHAQYKSARVIRDIGGEYKKGTTPPPTT